MRNQQDRLRKLETYSRKAPFQIGLLLGTQTYQASVTSLTSVGWSDFEDGFRQDHTGDVEQSPEVKFQKDWRCP